MSNTPQVPQTMLYKYPGSVQLHDGNYDHVVVDDDQIDDHLAQGWHLTMGEARGEYETALAKSMAPAPAEPQPEDQPEEPADDPVADPVLEQEPPADENAPATYEEMKAKAKELGLEFPGNIKKADLLALIESALAKQE